MIEDILKDLKELRDEMLSVNWPAQRLSNIITIYEMKLQEQQEQKTESQKLQDDLEPIDD